MSYEKQTWNKYDDLKTEEENIVNGAVVTDNRMNHIEEGIYSHTIDISNPHKVTAAQIGLDKVDNIQQAAKTDFKSHVNNKANPHAVTASQVGAYSKTEADVKFATGQSLIDLSTTVEGKADGSAVVHKTGNESVGGKKTFTDDMTVKNISASGSLTSKIVSTKMESPAIKHTFVRTGNIVTLTTETKSGIAPTTDYDIPSGYRPFNDGTDPIYEQVLSGGKSAIIRSSVATWQPRASAGLDAGLFGTTSWPTKDSFPG